MSRRRERRIVSSLRTPGRLLRLIRRASPGVPATLTIDECGQVVGMLRRAVRSGRLDGRDAVRHTGIIKGAARVPS